ncbi:Vacuolar fusion protein MON1-like protein A [Daphnia sinensis]|uniref:Vacuolar fusion protein MON1 homolog n=1 Tax=Daphnia sinensis TaxID=1820382 RepID=A0AAD5KT54_9CRUS|nr:Vacuolar fusion protein MON1-like protein A [Daphnia sinensis]
MASEVVDCEVIFPLNTADILGTATNSSHAILDSSDPYENLNNLTGARTNCDSNDVSLNTQSNGCTDGFRNGDVGLLEIAVEAQPDLVFESDLVPVNQDQQFIRPRVYLERESFSNQNEDSMSRTTNASSILDDNSTPAGDEESGSDSMLWKNQKKHFFVLSEAGKPIYTRHGNEEQLVTLFGVMQALVSFVEDGEDSMDVILAGDTKFVFLHKTPLILVAVSKMRDSVLQLLLQLEYIFNQISSVITRTHLEKIFEQRRNYDLRRLLAGSERLMDNLVNYMDNDFSVLLGAVKCLPMPASDRDAVTQTIHQQCNKIKNLVFTVLIGNNQLISLVRVNKKHLLHPSDVHLIINLVNSSETFKTAEGWTPICLPHFDPRSFLYVHASYLSEDCQACMLFFTTDRDSFFSLSDAKKNIVDRLRRHNNILESITLALNSTCPVISQLGCANVRHFVYKSRLSAQYTNANNGPPYQHEQGQLYLMDLYRHMHGRMHSASRPLKTMCHTTEKEILFGLVTPSYELYMILEPMTTKPAIVNAANAVLKWTKREEETHFITTSGSW